MLSIKHLEKTFRVGRGDVPALNDVSFDVRKGEFLTILGPSGCGKSTTLRSIAGLETPDSGSIELDGKIVFDSRTRAIVPAHERDLSMVFQSYAVWPHMTVMGNVAFPLKVQRLPDAVVEERASLALEMVGLLDVRDRSATLLSGGQQQRVALARALTKRPKVLLLDEPLSNLDAELRHSMRYELRSLQQNLGVTTVYVTHDQGEALSLSDRIVLMRDGSIVQIGSPKDLYLHPRNAFVARFIGQAVLLDGEIVGPSGGHVLVATALGRLCGVMSGDSQVGRVGTLVHVLVRPEHVRITLHDAACETQSKEANSFVGTIEKTQFSGSIQEHEVRVGSVLLRANSMSRVLFNVGDRVGLSVPTDRCIFIPQ
jgi:iron(III) transport system ATP-binding protein